MWSAALLPPGLVLNVLYFSQLLNTQTIYVTVITVSVILAAPPSRIAKLSYFFLLLCRKGLNFPTPLQSCKHPWQFPVLLKSCFCKDFLALEFVLHISNIKIWIFHCSLAGSYVGIFSKILKFTENINDCFSFDLWWMLLHWISQTCYITIQRNLPIFFCRSLRLA